MRLVYERWTDVNTFMRRRGAKDLSIEDLSNLAKDVNNFFLTYKTIKFININDNDWDLVKKIGETSNLHSSDVLHLVTAYVGACQVLITHDAEFIKEGNKVLKQEKVDKKLRVCDIVGIEDQLQELCGPMKIASPVGEIVDESELEREMGHKKKSRKVRG
jgi:predicted nucleic acid-binding protein